MKLQSNSASMRGQDHTKSKWSLFGGKTRDEESGPPSTSSEPPATVPPVHPSMSELDELKVNVKRWEAPKLREECISWCQEAIRAEEEVKAREISISVLQSQIVLLDNQVRKAQEKVFGLAPADVSKAEDDEIIRSKLRGVRTQWKMFAKEWAVKHLSSIKEEERPEVDKLLARLVVTDESQSRDSLWTNQSAIKASILLNAELARFLGKEIMLQPFISASAYVSETNAAVNASCPSMETLNQLYKLDKIQEHDDVNTAAANLWRSETVRLLDREGKPAQKRREKYYSKLVSSFENSGVRFLYHECDNQQRLNRRTQLLEIFRSTGELFSRLWSQRAYICVVGLEKFSNHRFELESDVLEAHAMHKLEKGDTSMDGRQIQLVVEPAICAWGNERGESYDVCKVWAKAVVCVSPSPF